MTTGDRAVAAVMIRRLLLYLFDNRASDFVGELECLRLNAIGSVVARTALDVFHHSVLNKFEYELGFWADVLHTLVARDVIADITK